MRNNHPRLTLHKSNLLSKVKSGLSRLRQKIRQKTCVIVNGGHELYRAHNDIKLYQECLLCGYQTHGWTVDRRDRRLHIVRKHAEDHHSSRTRRQ